MRKKSTNHHHAHLKIKELNDAEQYEETVKLFKAMKPYLDDGMSFTKAIQKVTGITHLGFFHQRWYRDLRDYAASKGYYTRWNKPDKLINGGLRI